MQKTGSCKTELSNCHKVVFTIFLSTVIRLPPKIIKYGNYKGFNENMFYKLEDPYFKLTDIFQKILQKHAPLKSEQVRGNHVL